MMGRCPRFLVICSLLGALQLALPLSQARAGVKESVVKIYTVFNSYSYHNPWQTKGQKTFHGSGCIISGKRILTNAHVVSDQIFVQVRRSGKAKRYTAKVVEVAHESDLAILEVEDDSFFHGVRALELGDLADIRDKVEVYGFPDGGDKLSITEGIVSRVEHVSYAHSQAYLLACQIDAPVNSGNSGGPVIKDGKVVGVAFQGMSGEQIENIGYMVPAPVIAHFLEDVADGDHAGIPSLGLSMQKLENKEMRRYYQLKEEQTGALVNKVYPEAPVEGVLATGDVVLAVDGVPVENDGTIEFRPGERTYFGYLVEQKQLGESVTISFLRKGQYFKKRLTFNNPLT